RADGDGRGSLAGSLTALGLAPAEWHEFLSATALALRGFAGMVRQIEERPDRVPAFAVPATLVDFLAVRLVLERAAITHVARGLLEFDGPIAELRDHLRAQTQRPPAPTIAERAWPLFHTAQLCGLGAAALLDLEPE